jgi:hypothetical protein
MTTGEGDCCPFLAPVIHTYRPPWEGAGYTVARSPSSTYAGIVWQTKRALRQTKGAKRAGVGLEPSDLLLIRQML